jgi:hypothetical protein
MDTVKIPSDSEYMYLVVLKILYESRYDNIMEALCLNEDSGHDNFWSMWKGTLLKNSKLTLCEVISFMNFTEKKYENGITNYIRK